MTRAASTVVALSGGVGGAKLALGLSQVLAPERLIVVANTGDDFEYLGLAICPDLDTLMYTLAGIENPETGWGRRDETWAFMDAMAGLGGDTWFRLGDRDLAVHVERTRRLRSGEPLSSITADFATRLGVRARLLPMSDDPVRTRLRSRDAWLDFQHWFVREAWKPPVTEIRFEGVAAARPQSAFIEALRAPDLDAVVFCPSNPFVSMDPILAVPGVREALCECRAPRVAVSPIVGGRAVKGPTAKLMAELDIEVTPTSIARHYAGLIDGLVVDDADAATVFAVEIPLTATRTVMRTLEDRESLARDVLAFAERLGSRRMA